MSVVLSMERSDDISVSIDIYAYCELADVCATFHRMSHGITLNMEVECEQQMQDLQDEELGDSRHTDWSDWFNGLLASREESDKHTKTEEALVHYDTSMEQELHEEREHTPSDDSTRQSLDEGVPVSTESWSKLCEAGVTQYELDLEDGASVAQPNKDSRIQTRHKARLEQPTSIRIGRDDEVRKPLTFIKVHTT